MPTTKELHDQATALYTEAKAILGNKDAADADRARVTPLLEEARGIMARVEQLKEVEALGAQLSAQGNGDADSEGQRENKSRASKAGAGFETWGDFLQQVYFAGHPGVKAAPDSRLIMFKDKEEAAVTEEIARKATSTQGRKDMAEGVGATGGYLVPAEFDANLQSVMGEASMVRSRATRIPMRRRQVNIPVLDQTGATAGIPHWFGGLRFYWEAEAGQKTPSDANFRQITLTAYKLIGYTRASDELVDDAAISLDAFLSGPMGFAGGVAWMEDYSFLQGSGSGQPLGVINAPATIDVARSADPDVEYIDLVNMLERFMPSDDGMWSFSQSVISNLMTMTDPNGNYLWPTLFGGGAATGMPRTLLGYPWRITEKQPVLGTKGDVLLASWKYYLLGDRQATTVESTKFDRWVYDQTSWRVVHRVDGQPWLSAPLTLQDGVTQISPFVVLGNKTT